MPARPPGHRCPRSEPAPTRRRDRIAELRAELDGDQDATRAVEVREHRHLKRQRVRRRLRRIHDRADDVAVDHDRDAGRLIRRPVAAEHNLVADLRGTPIGAVEDRDAAEHGQRVSDYGLQACRASDANVDRSSEVGTHVWGCRGEARCRVGSSVRNRHASHPDLGSGRVRSRRAEVLAEHREALPAPELCQARR